MVSPSDLFIYTKFNVFISSLILSQSKVLNVSNRGSQRARTEAKASVFPLFYPIFSYFSTPNYTLKFPQIRTNLKIRNYEK